MPVEFRDYYQILGVSKTASQDEVRSAFRKLARVHHPDTAKDKKNAEERFKELNEAYEVLGDPEKRRKYDEFGPQWDRPTAPPPGETGRGGFHPGSANGSFDPADGTDFEFGGTGYSDFFEQFFGSRAGGFSGTGTGTHAGPRRGRDVDADVMVTLEEALNGSTRQISFRRGETGTVQTYTVRIPKGVREAQRIRLAGQGGRGPEGGTPGDLFLVVRLQKHPDYLVEGADVFYEADVPVKTVVLGGDVEIPTLDGRVRLRIPECTQNGRKLRIAGRGLPKPGGARGDFYAVVQVELPEQLTDAERETWRKLP